MNTSLTDEQRARLHALAKTEAHRLRRMALDECVDAFWSGMGWGVDCLVHAARLLSTVLRLVRKHHH